MTYYPTFVWISHDGTSSLDSLAATSTRLG